MRTFVKFLLVFGACLLSAGAWAETYPTRPIRIVVPYPAGGGADALARSLAAKIAPTLGTAVVVENKAGAGGIIGTSAVAQAAPDGYTVLLTAGIFVQAPALFKKLPFDIFKDFAPVTGIGRGPLALVTRCGLPLTVDGLVALARSKPGKLSYATYSVGSTGHLYAESFKRDLGLDLLHVPYKGGAAAALALLAGEVDVAFLDFQSVEQHVKAGTLQSLAITGDRRFGEANVPTLKELGYPGFEAVGFYGVLAPAGTPRVRVERLSEAFARAVREPDIDALFRKTMFLAPWTSGPDEFALSLKSDFALWKSVVQKTGVEPQ